MEAETKTELILKIPADLRRRAEARAAMEGTTLSQVIRERLEEFAGDWEAIEEAEDLRAADEMIDRIARGEEPLKEWAEIDAELDRVQDQSPRDG